MKKIYAILSLLVLITVWSCDEKENMDPVGEWDLTSPVVSLPANNASVVLDENNPSTATRFQWQASTASNRFIVQYEVLLVPVGSTDYTHPILSLKPGNNARELSVDATAERIDYALSVACYAPGATVDLQYVLIANAAGKTQTVTQNIKFKRFVHERTPSTLYLTGEASEGGSDLSKAVPMRAQKDADGKQTGVFDAFTHLTGGKTFFFRDQAVDSSRKLGGSEGNLTCGTTIAAPTETGEYWVRVNLKENTYQFTKIDRWSLVGDGIEGGWGGDVPLKYVGNGVWENEVTFYKPYNTATWILRANGDWGYLLKRVKGTQSLDNKGGKVALESQATAEGLVVEDMPTTTGLHKVTLDLRADKFTYKLAKIDVPVETVIGKSKNLSADKVSGLFPIQGDTPGELYLFEGDQMILQLTKDGSAFKTVKHVALQANKAYKLNSAPDGSGTTFDGNDDGIITVDHDQAYEFKVDFGTKELSWSHWNLKLFHWDEAGGGWEQRQELLMTYVHPFKFEITATLTGGYDTKFNSPWDVQFGTASTALTGTMTNGGANFKGITSSGIYKASIVVTDDFQSGQYSFVKQ